MLKVIAEDFIKPEHLETVRPWYAELVEKTRQEPLCIAYELFVDQKDLGTSSSSNSGPIRQPWMRIARPSTSPVWYRRSMRIRPNRAGSC